MSPFAKFRLLDRQNSLQLKSQPTSPSFSPRRQGSEEILFKFTDPVVQDSAVQIKERLLSWCREKTKEYDNVKVENFSTSWNNGLAFCALIHHFRPDAFDYYSLNEVAGIFPLLDVEDMVIMRRPDWKCVFTYVQSIWRRFKDEN
ncbi:smoothelin-like protein 2 [Aphidius gifuensis]|uniref:smoothelin-like protein 2 n=1 Tax=Aphidius gifuensis TaxID=684658 RepID=UPI001CDBAE40|nr:smoothelin-like protein 2 [Aphidius gifuensis]